MRAFVDACIAIYAVEDKSASGQAVRAAIDALKPGDLLIATELVRFECLVGPMRRNDNATLDKFRSFFQETDFVELRRAVFERAATWRAAGLKPLDALHLAAAVEGQCDEFWTNDDRLSKVDAGIRIRGIV